MGMNQSTHIGVFLEFKNGQVEHKETVLKSPSTDKEYPLNGGVKFCPESGDKLQEHVKTIVKKIHVQGYIDGVEGLDEEMFWSPEGLNTIILPNKSSDYVPFMLNRLGGYYSDGRLDLSGVDIQETIERFKQRYAAHIKYYEEKYGPLEVKFGAVSYYS